MITVLIVIAILVVLIVVHEFGHFIAAKVFGVRVQEFGIGYPPRAFTFGSWGGTEYTLNWIPFGGFVRLFGDEGEPEHGKGAFVDAPRWKQAVILVAGVCMNALLAWVLFACSLHVGVPQAIPAAPAGQKAWLVVTDVVPGSPAAAAGIEPGDEITAMHDPSGASPESLSPDAAVAYVSARGGDRITLDYIRNGTSGEAVVTPANAVIPGAAGRPALGIALALVSVQAEPWRQAIADAFYQTGNAFATVGSDLWGLLAGAVHGQPNLSGVVGPVGIVGYVNEAEQTGLGSVLLLAALISVNLAIINLIPVPALDGGRLFVLAIEAVMRKSAPRVVLELLNTIGVVCIILLMIVVTYHDVARLLA